MELSPRKFIIDWFRDKKETLEFRRFAYEYHDYSDTHFVYCEPSPDDLDNTFQALFTDFIIQFEATFKDTSIGLLDENSLTKLEFPEIIFSTFNENYPSGY